MLGAGFGAFSPADSRRQSATVGDSTTTTPAATAVLIVFLFSLDSWLRQSQAPLLASKVWMFKSRGTKSTDYSCQSQVCSASFWYQLWTAVFSVSPTRVLPLSLPASITRRVSAKDPVHSPRESFSCVRWHRLVRQQPSWRASWFEPPTRIRFCRLPPLM